MKDCGLDPGGPGAPGGPVEPPPVPGVARVPICDRCGARADRGPLFSRLTGGYLCGPCGGRPYAQIPAVPLRYETQMLWCDGCSRYEMHALDRPEGQYRATCVVCGNSFTEDEEEPDEPSCGEADP